MPELSENQKKFRAAKRESKPLELDFKRIEFLPDEIDHARGIVASYSSDAIDASMLLEHLGLLPGQDQWYYKERDPLTPKPKEA